MFDSVLGGGSTPKSRLGTGTVISVLVHVGILGFAVWISTRPPAEKKEETDVKFFAAPPPPPPPPPPPGGGANNRPKTEKKKEKKVVKKDTIVQPKEVPTEKPKEADPEPESKAEAEPGGEEGGVVGGVEGGVKGGVVGGVIGGVIGGQLGGTLGGDVMAFGAGMTRPEQLSGQSVQYTREALEARVQGLMLAKCTITNEGKVENCQIVKPLPHMEKAALQALSTWRYKPATFQGKAVSVKYVIQLKLMIPNR